MTVPSELPDIGSTAQRLRANPRFDPVAAGIGPEDYFVWTRFDGATTLRDLILMTGLGTTRAVEIVCRLRALGAVLLPNERPEAVAARLRSGAAPTAAAPAAASRTPSGGIRSRPDTDSAPTMERPPTGPLRAALGHDLDDTHPTTRMPANALRPPEVPPTSGIRRESGEDRDTIRVHAAEIRKPEVPPTSGTGGRGEGLPRTAEGPLDPEELAALQEMGVDLEPEERRRILVMHQRARSGDPFAVLGIAAGSDRREVKRAYFALSKDFHPDRYYGRRVGSFGDRLTAIFEAVARAYAELTGGAPRNRRAPTPSTSTSTEHAADLFERACAAEISGDLAGALRLFAATLRLDPSARHLRRAARCALAAGEAVLAIEYAKKAAGLEPNDPSTARVLAAAFRAAGRYDDAEEVLVLALMIKTENDQLAHELRVDLAEVRRLAHR